MISNLNLKDYSKSKNKKFWCIKTWILSNKKVSYNLNGGLNYSSKSNQS